MALGKIGLRQLGKLVIEQGLRRLGRDGLVGGNGAFHFPARLCQQCLFLLLILLGNTAQSAIAIPEHSALDRQLAALEQQHQGRIGVALYQPDTGLSYGYRAEERFPFASTFKALLAAAVLQRSEFDPLWLQQVVHYRAEDLQSYAPITRQHLAHGMSREALAIASVQHSDNTAANLLLDALGGLDEFNRFVAALGDQKFRLDRHEPDLNSALPGDDRDTTTPAAMATTLSRLTLGNGLAAPQRARFNDWLKGNTTGDAAIRAGVPTGWLVGDKTGGGGYGTTNDIAVLWPKQGAPMVLALYFTQSSPDAKPQQAVLAEVTRLLLNAAP